MMESEQMWDPAFRVFANFLRPLRPSELSSRDFTSFSDTLIFADRIRGEGTHHRVRESWGTEVSPVSIYPAIEASGHELLATCRIGAPPRHSLHQVFIHGSEVRPESAAMGNGLPFSSSNKRDEHPNEIPISSFAPESSAESYATASPSHEGRVHRKRERQRDPSRVHRSVRRTSARTTRTTDSSPSGKRRKKSDHNYYNAYRRIPRACYCGDPECASIWRRFVNVKDSRRCGYHYVYEQILCGEIP
mmetsp:Transcript_1293/g.2323  ORF Transcript_1293/g.2323 Transcript_1293/m.2323 type:complete len:247 (-) Transcript_1293:3539-4279(-)